MFLATTSLQEYWKFDQEIILAGDWCKVSKKDFSSNPNIFTIPYIWPNAKKKYKALKYCNAIFEKTLKELSTTLNYQNSKNYSTKYYRILLGHWLMCFIHQAYDKYMVMLEAEKSGYTDTFCAYDSNYIFPENYLHYNQLFHSDLYQLQLFSQIIKAMQLPHTEKNINISQKTNELKLNHSIKHIVFYKSISVFNKFLGQIVKPKVICVNPYFKRASIANHIKLMIESKGKIIFDYFHYDNIVNSDKVSLDLSRRKKSKFKSKKFENWIFELTLSNIPVCYYEKYDQHSKHFSKIYKIQKKLTFLTHNDLYTNVPFQYFIAENYKKLNIFSAQHGCGYGMDKIHIGEQYERSIVDKFFTYGWVESKKTMPLEMPYLFKKKYYVKPLNRFLIATTTGYRYLPYFYLAPSSSRLNTAHVENIITFFKNVNSIKNIYIRHHGDIHFNKLDQKKKIARKIPNLNHDSIPSFYSSLELSNIFISDHIGTSFFEAMQYNIPTILFVDKPSYLFREKFDNYVEEFIRNKILFYCPKEAAIHFNSIENNFFDWWSKNEIQSLRKDFINNYALTSNNWASNWSKTLLS